MPKNAITLDDMLSFIESLPLCNVATREKEIKKIYRILFSNDYQYLWTYKKVI